MSEPSFSVSGSSGLICRAMLWGVSWAWPETFWYQSTIGIRARKMCWRVSALAPRTLITDVGIEEMIGLLITEEVYLRVLAL